MASESRKLYRSRSNRIIFGVCAGLAEFFGIDPTIVRLLFARGPCLDLVRLSDLHSNVHCGARNSRYNL